MTLQNKHGVATNWEASHRGAGTSRPWCVARAPVCVFLDAVRVPLRCVILLLCPPSVTAPAALCSVSEHATISVVTDSLEWIPHIFSSLGLELSWQVLPVIKPSSAAY